MGRVKIDLDEVDEEIGEEARCKSLVAAMIERALRDAYHEAGFYRGGLEPELIKREAIEWLYSDNDEIGGSEWAFQALGIDKKRVLNQVVSKGIRKDFRNRIF